jgi:hypothetical protein
MAREFRPSAIFGRLLYFTFSCISSEIIRYFHPFPPLSSDSAHAQAAKKKIEGPWSTIGMKTGVATKNVIATSTLMTSTSIKYHF